MTDLLKLLNESWKVVLKKVYEKFLKRIRKIPVRIWLTGILLVSFFLKLLCRHLDPVVSRDGCLYIRMAQIWHDAGSFQAVLDTFLMEGVETFFWAPPPLYLFLMKSLMEFGMSAESAGVWVNLIAGTLMPLLAYGIARVVTLKKDIALWSALLIALNPTVNALSHEVQRDMLYIFLIGCALWFLAVGIRCQKRLCWLGVGLVCGCAMQVRYETIEFFLLVPIALVILCIRKYCSVKNACCYAGLFFSSFALCIFTLSCAMHVQNILFRNYNLYFMDKFEKVKMQFDSDFSGSQKRNIE